MNWHEFVFSEKKSTRWLRHTTFWMALWLFFVGTTSSWWIVYNNKTYDPNPGLLQLGFTKWGSLVFLKSFSFLLIHLLACYVFVYVVLPRFLLKRNYISLAAGILVISIFLVATGYFIQERLFPMMDAAYHFSPGTEKNGLFWNSISFGLLNAPKVIAVATIIKLLKRWWLKQREKERLEKEKIDAELELLKAQIHPQFLFNSLNNIYSFALMSSPKSPEMLLKLSDILSYMLYECNDALVPLEKEIKMLKDYMMLEKTRYGDKLEMNIQVKGETGGQLIVPLLLLHFVETSFKQCSHKMIEQPWINLEINIEDEIFYMKLLNGKPMSLVSPGDDNEELGQVKKRLQLLYPGRHELKIVEEEEIFMVNLEIELKPLSPEGVNENRVLSEKKIHTYGYT